MKESATPTGWVSDTDLGYQGLNLTTHSWKGTFDLTTGLNTDTFKFRINDAWDVYLGYYDATLSGNLTDIQDNGGADFKLLVAGNYTITISTSDEGVTWTIDFQKN